jgi:hypothetical protein
MADATPLRCLYCQSDDLESIANTSTIGVGELLQCRRCKTGWRVQRALGGAAILVRNWSTSDWDTGFVCKACGKFFTDSESKNRDTKWKDIKGEPWLVEIIDECPLCGETRNYDPNELTMRGTALGKP